MAEYQDNKRIKQKCLTLIKDLTIYDEKLDQTYSDLTKFSNTSSKVIAGKEHLLVEIE
jgi:hypothetical protein